MLLVRRCRFFFPLPWRWSLAIPNCLCFAIIALTPRPPRTHPPLPMYLLITARILTVSIFIGISNRILLLKSKTFLVLCVSKFALRLQIYPYRINVCSTSFISPNSTTSEAVGRWTRNLSWKTMLNCIATPKHAWQQLLYLYIHWVQVPGSDQ